MLEMNQLALEFGDRVLFEDVSLQLFPGHAYGLVGANGTGKSSLLKLLTEQSSQYSGDLNWPKQAQIGYLKQDHFAYENTPIIETVIQGNQRLWQARLTQDALTKQGDMSMQDAELYAAAEDIILQEDGYSAESNAAQLLDGLGIPAQLHSDPLKTLSGGYKLRVLMAQLLFSKPDILLLDEPTNHLDIYSIKWLEDHLKSFTGLLLTVSHDRNFLNEVCSHILDIDYGTIRMYTGNYDAFLEAKALAQEQKEREIVNQEKRKEELKLYINRFRAKASTASSAQSRVKQLEKMEAIDMKPSSRQYPQFRFTATDNPGVIPMAASQLSKSFGDKSVLKNLNFEIERGDKVAIIGPNGVGKSTLLKILVGEMPPSEGKVSYGHDPKMAYFPQDYHGLLNEDTTCYDWLYSFDATASVGQIRNLLGRMLFSGDDVYNKLSTLSGGESARLIFAKMMLLPNNIIVLDEPTNHLDLEAIDMLTTALQEYDGTLILVSHNRYFVSQIATRILEVKPEGLYDFKGSYEEYLEKFGTDHLDRDVSLKDRAVLKEQKPKGPKLSGKAAFKARKALKKQIQKLEKQAIELENKLATENNADLEKEQITVLSALKQAEEELADLDA